MTDNLYILHILWLDAAGQYIEIVRRGASYADASAWLQTGARVKHGIKGIPGHTWGGDRSF